MSTFYTVKQVAKILGFSTNTIYKFLAEGRIKGVRMEQSGRFRIPQEEVDRFTGTEPNRTSQADDVILKKNNLSQLSELEQFFKTPDPKTLNLFDWTIGVLAILLGVAFALGPTYLRGEQFGALNKFALLITIGLIGGGGWLLIGDLFTRPSFLWNRLSTFLLLVLMLLLAILFGSSRDFGGMTLYLVLGFALVLKLLQPKFSSWRLFVALLFLFSLTTGLFWLLFPKDATLGALPVFLNPYRTVLGGLWLLVSGVYGFALVNETPYRHRFVGASLILAASLLFLAVWAVVEGAWDRMVYFTVLGVFSLLFPFWYRFEKQIHQNKRRILLGIAWMVIVIGIGLVYVNRSQAVVKNIVTNQTNQQRLIATALIEQEVQRSWQILEQVAEAVSTKRALKQHAWDDPALFKFLKEQYDLTKGLNYIGAVDTNGIVRAVYPIAPSLQGSQIADTASFNKVTASKQTVFGAQSPTITSPVIEGGELLGVVSGWVDVDELEATLATLKGQQKNAIFIGNQDGAVITSRQSSETNFPAYLTPLLQRAAAAQEGTTEVRDDDGQVILASYGPISSLNWAILSQTPSSAALLETDSLSMMIFIGFVGLSIVTLSVLSLSRMPKEE